VAALADAEITISVSPAFHEALGDDLSELGHVVVDATLASHECRVRGKFGHVEAGLEARLLAIARALTLAETGAGSNDGG